jgi:Uma2 family endonuclease
MFEAVGVLTRSFRYSQKKRDGDHEAVRENLTYEDYANMPDDGVRYELASGRLEAMTPAPHPRHQLVLDELVDAIKNTCKTEYIVIFAPVDVILSDTEVRQPDLVMLHRSRISILTSRGIEGPPDLVAEVLSPHSIKRDREDKRRSYARYGVPEYWIVDINNVMLEQYVLDNGEYRLEEVYTEEAPVRSDRVACLSFTMRAIIDAIPELPD